MDDETNISSLPRSSNPNPPLDVVVPDTIRSNPPKAERWVPYRNPQTQERTGQWECPLEPSGNKREDESYAAFPASDTNETNENFVQPDENTSSIPADLVEVTKRYAKLSEEERGWHWNLAPDGSFAMSTKTKKQKCRSNSKSARPKRRNPSRRAPTVYYKESSDEEDLLASDEEVLAPLRNHADRTPIVVGATRQASVASSSALQRKRKRQKIEDHSKSADVAESEEESEEEPEEHFECSETEYEDRDEEEDVPVGVDGSNQGRYDPKHWEEQFQLLVEYKNKHGNTNVPQRDGKLGKWVGTQRSAYRTNKLSQHRLRKLNSIDFKWNGMEGRKIVNVRYNPKRWEEQFQLLVAYKNKHGNTNVPQSDGKLGRWVKVQRTSYKQKALLQYRMGRLNSIDFDWCPNKKNQELWEERWEEQFQLLVEYKNKHGKTNVPQSDGKLGRWVNDQRTSYKQKKLLSYRIERLNSIDFEWYPNKNLPTWMEMYNQLCCYKKQHNGSTNVPARFIENQKLGVWVHHQRSNYLKSKISQERMNLLENIGFQWDPLKKQWMEMRQRLVAYKEKYESTRVPGKWKEDPKLAAWVNKQRTNYSKSKLSEEQIDMLESIGFQWDTLEEQWIEMFQRLLAYKEEYGSTLVPQRFKEDPKLGEWVHQQRKNYSKSKLSQKRINLLESIGFKWDPFYAQWMEMYQRLVAYNKKYGSTRVPHMWKEDPQLGIWVRRQRTSYSKKKMSKKRIKLLESIGFQWDASSRWV